ncbi:DUF6807 family protein [Pseudactinotalea terrae]|uniref:DUF6807 family protein n=1 Tax=Pseudactinotalea terrae TaxID=1743262 RepID=UPI001F5033B0|nr:DUF6807 family protein [Pseudactinotalea terrae]
MPQSRNASKPATIDDVARAAQVSRATVSRVMNGKATVDAELARRVQAAADELRYHPSTTARSLSLGRTNTVAVVVPDLGNPMFQEVLAGVSTAAGERDYRVLVADTSGDPGEEVRSISDARRRCDAIVLVSPRLGEAELRALLPTLHPVVVVNRLPDGITPTIGADYAAGAVLVMEHLTALGHQHLVYLAGPSRSEPNRQRIDAMRRFAASRTEVRLTELPGGASIASGYRAGEAVLECRATAVVAYNDLVAFGLLARLNELGVAVPTDISVTGFDNIALSRFSLPPLTTVSVHHGQLGELAWQQLTALLDGVGRTDPPLWVPELEPRASSGVVPATVHGLRREAQRAATAPPPVLTGVQWRDDPVRDDAGHCLIGTLADGSEIDLVRSLDGAEMPPVHSPRPYLHPVRTAAGLDLTEVTPADHRHHYGVSMAVALVNGTSFWGGRTYVRDEGPTLLANHGRQQVLSEHAEDGTLQQEILWSDAQGGDLLSEQRELRAAVMSEHAWSLRWRSELLADQRDLVIESPATAGRRGAGYGGLFWRLGPATTTTVMGSHGEGPDAIHGSISPWVAFVQHRGPRVATLVLAQDPDHVLPWFLRASDYVGAGPALAWSSPLQVGNGATLTVSLGAVMLDGAATAEEAEHLAAQVWA